MAAAATDSSTFPQFSSLPAELRNLIWRGALPDEDGPALYPLRKGCWHNRRLSESEPWYDPLLPKRMSLAFRYDLLGRVQVRLPLAYANREARRIALGWFHEHDIEKHFCEDKQCYIFTRPFRPMHDVLYVALDKVETVSPACLPLRHRSNTIRGPINLPSTKITRIAVPEVLFHTSVGAVFDMFKWFCDLETVLVIVNPQLDFKDDNMKMQRRWEVECEQIWFSFWDIENFLKRFPFWMDETDHIGDESLLTRIAQVSKVLSEEHFLVPGSHFEIRPALVVRR